VLFENFFNNHCDRTRKIKINLDKPILNFFANTDKLKKYFGSFEFESVNSGLYKTIKNKRQNFGKSIRQRYYV
jgi:hypothetical protein